MQVQKVVQTKPKNKSMKIVATENAGVKQKLNDDPDRIFVEKC